jgi:hypothetical protein
VIDWSYFLVNTVSVVAVTTDNTNLSGDDLRTVGTGTAYLASVQQGSASLAASLEAQGAIQAGQAVFTVFFAEEPIDTSGGSSGGVGGGSSRPLGTIRARDVVLWTPASGPVRTLVVLGPVRDEGGAGEAYSVDCVEVA